MTKPPIPENEGNRLATLRSLGLLDTPPEERFDRVTRLAKRLFNVPVALVSLVDENRQWFKSNQGLAASETPREDAFCAHTIFEADGMIVNDTLLDERFARNPLVTGNPNIRFYAGYPLTAPNGCKLGTLCVIDAEPRELCAEDIDLLRDLTGMVEAEFTAVELATMDELTGISNRRGFNLLAEKALETCKRLRQDVSLVAFDLNYFKEINDMLGHAAGDQALKDFARCLTDTFRDCDVIGRMGGDEFWVLLCDAHSNDVPSLLNRFQDAVSTLNHVKQRPYRLDYSVGTASCSPYKPSSIKFMGDQADADLYEHKQSKRNAVSIA